MSDEQKNEMPNAFYRQTKQTNARGRQYKYTRIDQIRVALRKKTRCSTCCELQSKFLLLYMDESEEQRAERLGFKVGAASTVGERRR